MTTDLSSLLHRIEHDPLPLDQLGRDILSAFGLAELQTGCFPTNSLSHAVGLVERVSPEWDWQVERIKRDGTRVYAAGDSTSWRPELALCAALVRGQMKALPPVEQTVPA